MSAGLTRSQQDSLARQLSDRYAELLDQIRDELEGSGEPRQLQLASNIWGDDVGIESVADLLLELGTATMDRHGRELREIQAARRRIADGTYGTCDDCGDPIGLERLRAFPTASRCIEDQEAYDRDHGAAARPASL